GDIFLAARALVSGAGDDHGGVDRALSFRHSVQGALDWDAAGRDHRNSHLVSGDAGLRMVRYARCKLLALLRPVRGGYRDPGLALHNRIQRAAGRGGERSAFPRAPAAGKQQARTRGDTVPPVMTRTGRCAVNLQNGKALRGRGTPITLEADSSSHF